MSQQPIAMGWKRKRDPTDEPHRTTKETLFKEATLDRLVQLEARLATEHETRSDLESQIKTLTYVCIVSFPPYNVH